MENIIVAAESFVIKLLSEKLSNNFLYHNLSHTQRVVEKVKELAETAELTDNDTKKLLIASWFHDTGFTINPNKHEEESVQIVTQFLKDHNADNDFIGDVAKLILVTKLNSKANSFLEKLIKDADCSHIGSKNYEEYSLLLQKETELTSNKKVS